MFKMIATYIIFWVLIQLLVEINCQMIPFKPKQRYLHTATLINNKLYILGGFYLNHKLSGNEFFYLDFSVPFNTQNLLWQDLSSINIVPPHGAAATVKGGANNNTLFLYGGVSKRIIMELVYAYDPQENAWSTPTIVGLNTIRKRNLIGIMDYNGKMYLWSGLVFDNNPKGKLTLADDMLILDTINLNWGKGSSVGAPTPRFNYAAVMLANNSIIYLGGYGNKELELSEVYIYDTINDSWDIKETSGKIPSNRNGFSAVLGLDGQKIIIFGGTATDAENSLCILNLTDFEWYIPKISGQIPKGRMYHQANVIGNYMVISFGMGYDQLTESDILLLDINNNDEYTWTNDFITLPSSSSVPSPTVTQLSPPTNSPILQQQSVAVGTILGSLFDDSPQNNSDDNGVQEQPEKWNLKF
ncbi:hypothetical protein C1645_871835 [Glomus cerebriforme]|uniref:Galactose oxidase n=1 Tax=Glomus cerebriforme TaxID=658196 RepID=A0A397TH90_9GLOM|nr:hypothetical protein C1645_871835 [Glomus cerebriforme]